MQKHVNLVDLVKSFPTNSYLQNLASIQKRTSSVKFAHLDEKSGKGSISNLSTKVFRRVPLRRDHADVPRLLPVVGFLNEAAENVRHVPEHGRLRAHALHPLHRCTRAVFLTLGVGCRYQQTSNGSFSAVSKPMFSIKYLLE